jgi:hypothetical protein
VPALFLFVNPWRRALSLPVFGEGRVGLFLARYVRGPHPTSLSLGQIGEGSSQLQLFPSLSQRAQAQRVEADEAGGVAVVVGDFAFLEGDEVLVVE